MTTEPKTRPASRQNIGISSNNDVAIECCGRKADDDLVTYTYEVRRLSSDDTPYYWVLAMCQMVCLADGKTIRDFVVSATRNGRPIAFAKEQVRGPAFLGLDPITHIMGCRFEEVTDRTGRYTITLDTTILQPDAMIDTGHVLAATAVGDQDIQEGGSCSPGYLCVPGPVCACLRSVKTCETAFAVTDGRAKRFTHFDMQPGNHEISG